MLERLLSDFYPEWERYIDRALLICVTCLIGVGIVVLTSASVAVAEKNYGSVYYFLNRHLMFLGLGLLAAWLVYQIRMGFWQNIGPKLLFPIILLLVAVLVPFIGKEVNGSSRWIDLGFLSLQISEITKVSVILYMSGYLVRHGRDLAESRSWWPLVTPLLIIIIIDGLLIMEPDFGSVIIVTATGLSMLFLGGVRFIRLGYRMARMVAFLNPWDHALDKGYQTVHSLMGIGDGGWFGAGLGASVQKLFYLPEAHNDYVFAVLAEEFGFIGMLITLMLFSWLVHRAFVIGFNADKAKQFYGAYVAYGIGFWIGFQVLFHIGVNLAILPPKGLTLPFISYGGSSLLTTLVAIALLMRVHRDTQIALFGIPEGKQKDKTASTRPLRQRSAAHQKRVKKSAVLGRGGMTSG